jgi:hypothetical protein
MFSLIEHAAEAVLGPWGLLAGAVVGVALLTRRRETTSDQTGAPRRNPVRQAGTAVASAGEWWSDLVAEARAEWETEREVRGAATPEQAADRLQAAATRSGRRRVRRDTGGSQPPAEA